MSTKKPEGKPCPLCAPCAECGLVVHADKPTMHAPGCGRPRFILLNQSLPASERGGDGPDAGGALGRIGLDNVYLATYGSRPEGSKSYADLAIGEEVPNVRYALSGQKATLYTVRRVS